MRLRFFLIPMILATTTALADSPPSAAPQDGHAKAVGLLTGVRGLESAKTDHEVSSHSQAWLSADGQAKAAALLSRPRTS